MTIDNKVYVQYGCGLCAPDGWLNFDSSPTLRLEKICGISRLIRKRRKFPHNVLVGDIVRGLGLPDNSAHGVYSSHVLEHLALEEFTIALNNTFKLLRPGAIFRLVVPDLEWRARQYVTSLEKGDARAAAVFMRMCRLGRESSPKSLTVKLSLLFGGSAHLWMWDELSMRDALVSAGFDHVRRCEMGDSGDPMFGLVEDRGRFFDQGFPELAFEARKPADFQTFAASTDAKRTPVRTSAERRVAPQPLSRPSAETAQAVKRALTARERCSLGRRLRDGAGDPVPPFSS